VAASFESYRRVLALPGAWVFSVSGLVARLPIAMVSLGIVLLVSNRTGSFGLAGAVAASFLVANAATGILLARLIDGLGQHRVLPGAVAVFAAGLVGMMAAVEAGQSPPWPHVFAAVAGTGLPPIGSSIRARWTHLVTDTQDLHTAFAFESVLDEVVFIVGPALVTILAATVHPLAGLSFAVVATVVGTAVLVTHTQSEPPTTSAQGDDHRPQMPWRVLIPMGTCAVVMGALLGGTEVATTALAGELGAASLSGLMLGIWAAGSLVSAIIAGAVHPKAGNAARFRRGLLALGLSMLPLLVVDGFVSLGVLLFLSGFAISPTLIAAFAMLEEAVPRGRITEGITLFTTGLGAGLAPGAGLAGMVVDRGGASASFWVPVGAGIAGAAVAMLSGRGQHAMTTRTPDLSRGIAARRHPRPSSHRG